MKYRGMEDTIAREGERKKRRTKESKVGGKGGKLDLRGEEEPLV